MGGAIRGSYILKTFCKDWMATALEKTQAYHIIAKYVEGVHGRSCTFVALDGGR
jgi:hypothetical protein